MPTAAGLRRPSGGAAAWLAAALVLASLLLSLASTAVAAFATPTMDFAVDGIAVNVSWVLPGGQSWDAGVRPGQPVLGLNYGVSAGDWRLDVATGSGTSLVTTAASHLAALRSLLPIAGVSGLLALLALLLMTVRRELAVAVGLIAMTMASAAIGATNAPAASTVVLAGVPLAGAAWLAVGRLFARRGPLLAVVAVAIPLWIAARVLVVELFAMSDILRVMATGAVTAVALVVAAPWRSWTTNAAIDNPPRTVDLAAFAVILVAGVAALALTSLPALPVSAGAGLVLVGYLLVRTRLAGVIEHVVVGGIRDEAAIAATEDERARLAAEIHDGPLQVLAAAVTMIRDHGPTDHAVDLLDEAGLELRAVCAALRPPVLDDLGLGPALAWLIDQTRTQLDAHLVIMGDVHESTGISRSSRLPAAVELAAFRIAQEAVANSVRHAQAGEISVHCNVAADGVHLEIRDDGRGIRDSDVRRARRAGRLGTFTMKQRASSVGGRLGIGAAAPAGTLVVFDWRQA